jgi:hypothetical protein
MSEVKPDWAKITEALKAPFAATEVDWRVQGKSNAEGKSQVLAYIDARAVQERLDAVVGPENWSFDWQPVVTNDQSLLVAKGTLTIHGVSKSDVGDASNFEGNKGTISDTLKRCGVMWGIARYLYDLPQVWITLEKGKIPEATLKQLQARLAARGQEKKAS